MDYYRSSPQEFYYACEGYFDERREQVQLMRNVALFASQRSGSDFNKYWPETNERSNDSVAMSDEMRAYILKMHKIKKPNE